MSREEAKDMKHASGGRFLSFAAFATSWETCKLYPFLKAAVACRTFNGPLESACVASLPFTLVAARRGAYGYRAGDLPALLDWATRTHLPGAPIE